MKLFTKDIDKKLFAQYTKGSDLANQMVVAKIFNPYGRGTWYIINSDPDDPDYLWAIVDLMDVEVGSVSRSELESILVPPFRLNLERDTSFSPTNALELYKGLRSGKMYQTGGTADSAMSNDPMIGGTMASSMKNGGGVDVKIPPQGTMISRDKKNKLDYKKVGNNYEFIVYEGEPNPVENYSRTSFKKKSNGVVTMNYNQFINYIYSEGYVDDKMARGGDVKSENAQMVANNVKQIAHHTKEMADALKDADHVPAWVVSKVYRAASDLSDATHYMEGENSKMAEGGSVFVSDVAIVPDKDGNNYLFPNPTDVNATGMMMEQGGDVYSYDTQDGEFMAKGGNIKQIPVGEEYRYKPSNSIESDIMAKVSQQMSGLRFAGNLYIKGFSGDVYLYFLDSYDRDFVSNIGIKPNERIYRYVTRATAIGGMIPLLKVNLDSGLVYFNESSEFGDESVVFSKKGVKAEYINLVRASEEDYYANGGGVGKDRYILSFNYNPSIVKNEYAEGIVSKYTKDWNRDNDWDEVTFYVQGLTKQQASELRSELKMEDVYNIEIEKGRYTYSKGGGVGDKKSLGGVLVGAAAVALGASLLSKKDKKPSKTVMPKSEKPLSWKEEVADTIDKEGFDYAFDGYSDFSEIKNTRFHVLRKKYLSDYNKLKKLVEKNDFQDSKYNLYVKDAVDKEGFDYAFNGYASWKGVKNTTFQTYLSEYKKSRKALASYIGLGDKYAEGGATPAQKRKIGKVMREWKEGELNIGKSDKKVKSQKQAVAIALSQAGLSKKEEGGKMMGWKHKRK